MSTREALVPLDPLSWLEVERPPVVHPVRGPVPFIPRDYQAMVLADWQERGRILVKARQLGFSQCFAAEAAWKLRFRPPRRILVVSRDLDSAFEFAAYCRAFIPDAELVTDNKSQLWLSNGSRLQVEAATKNAGRSFTASDVYLDEFAHAPFPDSVWQAVQPTVASGGTLTVFSSPRGRANFFYLLYTGQIGNAEWRRYRVPWWALWDEDWAARQRRELTAQQFAEEYGADFVESGEAVFREADISACLEGHNAEPSGCDAFVTAWDIGRRRDATVGVTLGKRGDTYHLLQFERIVGAPYPAIQRRIEERCEQWKSLSAWHAHHVESNGVGDPVIENLNVQVKPFVTTAKSKAQAITKLQLLIEQGRFKFGPEHEDLERELLLYQWDDQDIVQDCIMAAAIAVAAPEPTPFLLGWTSRATG